MAWRKSIINIAQTSLDLLEDCIDIVNDIQDSTENLPVDPADASDIAASFSITDGKIDVVDTVADAIKLKTDLIGALASDETVDNLLSRLYVLQKHSHSVGMVYPLRADPISLAKDVGVWADFNATKTQIVPVNTIASPFDIHYVNITNLSAVGNYLIALYYGGVGAEVLCGYAVATRTAIGGTEGTCPVISAGNALHNLIPANSRISAALTSGNNAADTLQIKIHYHIY